MKTYSDYGIQINESAPGPEVYTTCPQCSGSRKKQNVKCLSVNIEKEVWICFHCDFRGTLKTGVEDKGNPYAYKQKVYRKPEIKLTDLPGPVIEWFKTRGISEKVLSRNKIGYEKVYMPQLEDFASAIRFPFYRNGELINVKSRDGKKNFRLESGSERIFFGLDDIAETSIIVEGEIDKLSVEEAGFVNCMSVPDGAPSPKAKDYTSKFDFLGTCEAELSRVKTFILAVDNDEPGKVLQEELARRLGKDRCKMVLWPDGCKDANDVLLQHGAGKLSECISAATHYPVEGLYDVAELALPLMRLYENGVARGDLPGWSCVDELYSVRPGEWTLVTGIPGHGKSEFMDAMSINLVSQNWRFAVFSPENQPLERHIAKLAEKAIGKPFFKNKHVERMSLSELDKAQMYMNQVYSFILPKDDELTIDGVLGLAKTAILRKGVKGIMLDPWNELDHSRPAGLTETEYISQSLSKIRRFARAYGVHIWLVVHPTKMQKVKQEDGSMDYPVPTPYDCSGSAHWRNKADNCLTVYRDFKTNKVQLHVQKIRFREVGRVGVAELNYDINTGRYYE
jgi:twinkle protein